ncbi:hypothetical protein TRIP_B250210 [uncultured Desulfatiglans sp.]|nr:hypothetical protein TRIP_B250210 [uncultured Desulfatiglans sp.]
MRGSKLALDKVRNRLRSGFHPERVFPADFSFRLTICWCGDWSGLIHTDFWFYDRRGKFFANGKKAHTIFPFSRGISQACCRQW